MAWTETTSLSFTARHEASQSDDALEVLERLEAFRTKLEGLFPRAPTNVAVVLHDSQLQLALAQPLLPIGRRLAGPAGRRYMSGWFTAGELHTLSPLALRRLAAGADSLQALRLTPERVYTLLTVGVSNPLLPPPFRPSSLNRYLRSAWIAEGAAQYFSGQLEHLRPAIARRLRGPAPSLPPGLRDASLLGGSVFDLLARTKGNETACVRLATYPHADRAEPVLEEAFDLPYAEVERNWRAHVGELATAKGPSP
jgi:hypothetical protein